MAPGTSTEATEKPSGIQNASSWVVGTSAEDHRHAFRSIGVERYLDKGWQLSDLISAVNS